VDAFLLLATQTERCIIKNTEKNRWRDNCHGKQCHCISGRDSDQF
jgi:hypothetical protein